MDCLVGDFYKTSLMVFLEVPICKAIFSALADFD